MAHITVVPLGPGDPKLLTLQSAEALRSARHLILRTAIHRAAAWLESEGIPYSTLDAYYDRFDDFDAMHAAMAEALWQEAHKHPVTYAVADPLQDASVTALAAMKPSGSELTVFPGVSLADAALAQAPEALSESGYRIVPATALQGTAADTSVPLLVTELNSQQLASEAKLCLMDTYDSELEVWFFPTSAKRNRKPLKMCLCEIDRQASYDHTVCVLLPAVSLLQKTRFTVSDLAEVMEILRGENGCPWDKAQTHETLRKYLLEEAYEAASAIDEGDEDHLYDELGDVLLQIVFHASIGKAEGSFNLTDVATAICRKMIHRHPHVFAKDSHESFDWETLKKEEKGLQKQADVLADVALALPALARAAKVQKKAAQVGFDWDGPDGALDKVIEETRETREELAGHRDLQEELGDLLFACVNAARLSGVDPERALELATEKFIRRFRAMEEKILADGRQFSEMTLPEMDRYWDRVKAEEKKH